MKKILIIGRKSFLGSNLKINLSKSFNVENLSFNEVLKKEINSFSQYSHVINTAIHPKYVKNEYVSNFDLDKKFINKFRKIHFKYVYLSSRKIYFQKESITEKSLLQPRCNYSKNKLHTENYLKKKLKKNILILRISNILGKRIYKNTRNTHKLFFDNFLNYRKNKKKIRVNNDFKDFLSIDQFCTIIKNIIRFNLSGVYNVSLGEKIYVSEVLSWLDKDFFDRVNFTKLIKKDSFTLSNKKLIKKIKIRITKNQLKRFCKKLV